MELDAVQFVETEPRTAVATVVGKNISFKKVTFIEAKNAFHENESYLNNIYNKIERI